jgi:hypothetical protein
MKKLPTRLPAWAALAIALAVALLLYLPALGFGYVWDDNKIFSLRVAALLRDGITLSGLGDGITSGLLYYRPLVMLSFCLDAYVSGFNPHFSHGVNLAIFLANLGLLFAVTQRLAARIHEKTGKAAILPAFCATLVYALHPVMTEPVLWISGRFDLLVTFFILLALFCFLEIRQKLLRILVLAVLMLCMLLCKETGALFPSSILCLWFALHGREHGSLVQAGRRALREHAGLLLAFAFVVGFYFFLRWQTFGGVEYGEGDPLLESPLAVTGYRLWLPLETLKFYFFQTGFPFLGIINVQHPLVYESVPGSAADLAGILVTLALLAGAFFFALSRRSPVAWLLIAGLFYLLPVLHIFHIRLVTGWNIGHERFLATPLAFWVIALALIRYERILSLPVLTRISAFLPHLSFRHFLWGFACAWLALSLFKTFMTVPFWHSDLRLWAWTSSIYPGAMPVYKKYISVAMTENRVDLIEAEIQRIIEQYGESSLDAELALIRARVLLQKRDPAALPLLESLLAPDIFRLHEQGADTVDSKLAKQAVYLYSSYSRAVLLFQRDPQKALQINASAYWYAQFSHKVAFPELVMNQMAALYAQGRFPEADALQKTLPPERLDNLRQVLNATLDSFCHAANEQVCQDLRAHNILTSPAPRENTLFP